MSSNESQSSMSDNINLTSLSPEPNPSNSFYASFKIYINKFSSGSGGSPGSEKHNSNFGKTSPKKSDTNAGKTKSKHSCGSSGSSSSPTKIVRIEQIECDENSEFVDSGFVKTCDETDNEDVFLDAIHEPSKGRLISECLQIS